MAVPPDRQLPDLVEVEFPVTADRGRVQQPDQVRERAGLPVVRGGGRQQQRVGLRCEDAREPAVLRLGVRHVVRLVYHDGVPAVTAQVVDEPLLFEGVDGDDDPAEIGERVPAGRQLLLDPRHTLRVETHERDREPRPQLVLHLLQHVARGHHEDPLTPAAPDQLGQDHADLQGLAQSDGVGQQDPGTQGRGIEGLRNGALLIPQGIGEHAGRDRQGSIAQRDRGLTQHRLKPQPGTPVSGRVVGPDPGLPRITDLDGIERGIEHRLLAAYQLREPRRADHRAIAGLLHLGDEPFLIADHHDHPRSEYIAHLASYPFLDGDSLANGGGGLPQVKTPIDTGKISGLLSEASASELR